IRQAASSAHEQSPRIVQDLLHRGRELSMNNSPLAMLSGISIRLRTFALILALIALSPASMFAKVVVFWQPGFPTVASQPVDRSALTRALDGMDPVFADLAAMEEPT